MTTAMRVAAALPACLIAAACSGSPPAPSVQDRDPAVAAALLSPLTTDPELLGQANGEPVAMLGHAIPIGANAPVPPDAPTLGEVASAAAKQPGFAGCDPRIAYSAQWMNRLAPPLALPRAARLSEGAGSDTSQCSLRIVRYWIPATPRQIAERYAAIRRKGDGGHFTVLATAMAGGTTVDLVSRR